jgi:hypothetical protein
VYGGEKTQKRRHFRPAARETVAQRKNKIPRVKIKALLFTRLLFTLLIGLENASQFDTSNTLHLLKVLYGETGHLSVIKNFKLVS